MVNEKLKPSQISRGVAAQVSCAIELEMPTMRARAMSDFTAEMSMLSKAGRISGIVSARVPCRAISQRSNRASHAVERARRAVSSADPEAGTSPASPHRMYCK